MPTVAQRITAEFIDRLRRNEIPWHRPWKPGYSGAVSYGTGHAYSLINQWRLSGSGEYIGVRKAIDLGLDFRGARREKVVWYGPYDRRTVSTDPETGEETTVLSQRFGYTEHNVLPIASVRDADGTPLAPRHADPDCPSPDAVVSRGVDAVISDYLSAAGVRLLVSDSFTAPAFDVDSREIRMLPVTRFESMPAYYAALFRLLIASTAVSTLLDRHPDGDRGAVREELVREIGSALLLSAFSLDTPEVFDNSAAYASAWAERLSRDDGAILSCAGQAEKAANLVLGLISAARTERGLS